MKSPFRVARHVALVVSLCGTATAQQEVRPAPPDPNAVPPAAPESAPPPNPTPPAPPPVQPEPATTPQAFAPAVALEPAAPPPAEKPPGVHEHDGFYAHFGLGFGGYTDAVTTEDRVNPQTGAAEDVDGVITGFATVSEVAVGGTVARGFVLGVGIYSTTVYTSTFTPTDEDDLLAPRELERPENFALAAVFGDWYFNPDRGVHLQLGLGFATISGLNPESPRGVRDRGPAIGGGVMLGIGHEWWVGNQWGIGVLGRLTAGVLTEKDDADVRWLHVVAAFPTMLVTATYH